MSIVKIEEVLKILKREFPEMDFFFNKLKNKNVYIAGQAIASAVFEILNLKIKPVYNDLDIFFYNPFSNQNIIFNIKAFEKLEICHSFSDFYIGDINSTINFSDFIITDSFSNEKEDYKHKSKKIEQINLYNINKTARFNKLNFIEIDKKIPLSMLVQDFDINATQIGISLANNEIYLTKNFIEFLNNPLLSLVNYSSPYHSIIRLIKKEEELEILADKEKSFIGINSILDISEHFLSDFKISVDRDNDRKSFYPSFGEKYFDKAYRLEEINKNYLILKEDYYKNNLYRLEHKEKSPILEDFIATVYKYNFDHKYNVSKETLFKYFVFYFDNIYDNLLNSKKIDYFLPSKSISFKNIIFNYNDENYEKVNKFLKKIKLDTLIEISDRINSKEDLEKLVENYFNILDIDFFKDYSRFEKDYKITSVLNIDYLIVNNLVKNKNNIFTNKKLKEFFVYDRHSYSIIFSMEPYNIKKSENINIYYEMIFSENLHDFSISNKDSEYIKKYILRNYLRGFKKYGLLKKINLINFRNKQ